VGRRRSPERGVRFRATELKVDDVLMIIIAAGLVGRIHGLKNSVSVRNDFLIRNQYVHASI
jgi:hypothetical protein